MQEKLNNFGLKYGNQKNKKAEWISNMTEELEGLEIGPKAEIHIGFLRTTLKNIKLINTRLWWNAWILVQEIHSYSRQISTRNEPMPTRTTRAQMDDQKKDHIDSEGSSQRNCPKQLQTHNLPTD